MKDLRSKAKHAFCVIMEELRTMRELRQKEEEVEDIMDYTDKVLEEPHVFFNKCMDYLNSPASPHALAPVPAWNGLMPSQEEARRAFDRLTELMNETLPLLNDVTAFREQYTDYCNDITAFMQQRTEFVKNLEKKISDKERIAVLLLC